MGFSSLKNLIIGIKILFNICAELNKKNNNNHITEYERKTFIFKINYIFFYPLENFLV
jgi:hypothetical protein